MCGSGARAGEVLTVEAWLRPRLGWPRAALPSRPAVGQQLLPLPRRVHLPLPLAAPKKKLTPTPSN